MKPVIYKFGGTSVADAARMEAVAHLVADGPQPLVVVVSAMRGITDDLVALADEHQSPKGRARIEALRARHLDQVHALDLGSDEYVRNAALKAGLTAAVNRRIDALVRDLDDSGLRASARRDAVLATGEDLVVLLLAAAIRAAGRHAVVVDARTLVRTDNRHGAAVPDGGALPALADAHLRPLIEGGTVAVVQGFVGSTAAGVTTTLGRGGGDFTAALLGGALSAEVVHIWTDVIGVMSGDPRMVRAPRRIAELGFEEAVELAWAGAKVIHPVAAKWAVARGVPLRIRSTFEPSDPGTLVRNDVRGIAEIAAVTAKAGVALMKVRSHPSALPYGFLARVFEIMARHELEVDLVATSHSSTAFTIDRRAELDGVARELESFADVEILRGLTTVTVVGRGLLQEPGMNTLVFRNMDHTPVHLISQASDVSLSLVVDEANAPELVRRLHVTLIELRAEVERRRSA